MARILITGGAGYVGSHTSKALAARGHDSVVFDNLSRGHREFVRWGPLIVGDVRDPAALDAVFKAHRIDAVLHFAALAYVAESVTEPGRYYDVNVNGTRTLLDAMNTAGVGAMVFSSTCAIYGEPATATISEETRPAPINPYGMSKLVCERMMDDFGHAHGLRSIRLRYFNAAGCDPDLEIGEDHQPETHLIPLVLDAAIGRRASITIFGTDFPTPDGTPVRDYVHVGDLADAHVRAVDSLLAGASTTALNLGTGRGVSVAELIATAERVTGHTIPTIRSARRPGDPGLLIANPSLAKAELGWSAKRSDLETILGDAWGWHQHRFGAGTQ